MSNTNNNNHVLDGKKSAAKAPERSNFINTCNLLSQFLKEKGGLKDLNREITGKLEALAKSETNHGKTATTKDLLNTIEDLNQPPTQGATNNKASPSNQEDATNKAATSRGATEEPKIAQMTIFYDGKIWVFEGLSTDKAGEVMLLASKGSSHWSGGNLSTSASDVERLLKGKAVDLVSVEGINRSAAAVPPSVPAPAFTSASASTSAPPVIPASSSGKQPVQPQIDANGSDLPIARRSSLHRFLEKRKDRAAVRGPYQAQNAVASPGKSEDQQLELKL